MAVEEGIRASPGYSYMSCRPAGRAFWKGSSRNVFREGNGGSFQAVSQHCPERAGSVNREAPAVEVLQLVILRLW